MNDHILRCDLLSRFVINLPEGERQGYRHFYHLEHAYWFYLDNHKHNETESPEGFASFVRWLYPQTKLDVTTIRTRYKRFLTHYKYKIPTAGLIVTTCSNQYVLMVKSRSSKKWGFPKGKQNYKETAWECARRECWEETGLALPTNFGEHVPGTTKPRLFRVSQPCALGFLPPPLPPLPCAAKHEIMDRKWCFVQDGPPHNTARHAKDVWRYLVHPHKEERGANTKATIASCGVDGTATASADNKTCGENVVRADAMCCSNTGFGTTLDDLVEKAAALSES